MSSPHLRHSVSEAKALRLIGEAMLKLGTAVIDMNSETLTQDQRIHFTQKNLDAVIGHLQTAQGLMTTVRRHSRKGRYFAKAGS